MIPVVINADDFGLTEGVCAGIVKAIQAGGVTATTAMACVPGAVERLKRWAPKIPEYRRASPVDQRCARTSS